MKKLFIGTLCAIASTAALADDWIRIFQTDTSAGYVNLNKVNRAAAYPRVWVALISIDKNRQADVIASLLENDCYQGAFRPRQVTSYSLSQVKSSRNYGKKGEWEYVLPNSLEEDVHKFACQRDTDPQAFTLKNKTLNELRILVQNELRKTAPAYKQ